MTPNQDLRYFYDALGNRIKTILNGVTTTYEANNLNQYTSVGGVSYTYDADGNLTFDGVNTYGYDQQSRLVSVSGPGGVTQYEYDALGNRTASVFSGQRTEYLLDPTGLVNVTAEYGPGNSLIANYRHGLGLVSRSSVADTHFYNFDAIGSVAELVDATGISAGRYIYEPFGKVLQHATLAANSFTFGEQLGIALEKGELDFMRARYYYFLKIQRNQATSAGPRP